MKTLGITFLIIGFLTIVSSILMSANTVDYLSRTIQIEATIQEITIGKSEPYQGQHFATISYLDANKVPDEITLADPIPQHFKVNDTLPLYYNPFTGIFKLNTSYKDLWGDILLILGAGSLLSLLGAIFYFKGVRKKPVL